MNTPPFIIVADRGLLKAYAVENTPARPAMPRLIGTLHLSEPHQRYAEKFSDQAGSFPNGGTGGQGNSVAERMTLDAEGEMRAFRRIAEEITALLQTHRPERWAFAAPSEINGAILNGLKPEWKERLSRNIPRDLVKIAAPELLAHFQTAG
jgi:hypothetical protein